MFLSVLAWALGAVAVAWSFYVLDLLSGRGGGMRWVWFLLGRWSIPGAAVLLAVFLVLVRRARVAPQITAAALLAACLLPLGTALLDNEERRESLFQLRFKASHSALDRYVTRAQAGRTPQGEHRQRLVGLFLVRETEVLPTAVRLITTDCHFADTCGLVYVLEGDPPVLGEDSYWPIEGNWFWWLRSW